MVERPIIFSSPMVRALLAGTKTQTRQVLKLQLQTFEVTLVHAEGESLPRIKPFPSIL